MRELASGTDRQIFGKLGSVDLNDIIQLLGMSKRTATLELRRGDERGRLYFRNGQIIHATAGRYEGEESFIELLGWGDAEFSVEEGVDSLPKISITKSTEALLLSTMTTLDEIDRIRERPPVQIAPSIKKRRLLPRPELRPARSRAKVALVLVGLTGTLVASLVGLVLTPALWAEPPWRSLPSVDPPLETAPALMVPDALSVARGVWDRPGPIAPVTTTSSIPVAPVVAPAFLTVVVDPWARVTIDETPAGQTPLGRLELAPGPHRVTLSNDGIVGVIRDDIALESGQHLTKRYSFNDTGYLRVVVTPWADVIVDGRAIGQTPLGRVATPAGSHVVRFVHPELGATERNVEVVSGQTTLVKVQLR